MSKLALTPGDPAGIGPDITVKLAQHARVQQVVAFCCPEVLRERAERLQLPLKLHLYDPEADSPVTAPGELCYVPVDVSERVVPGSPDSANAGYVLECLDKAFEACFNGTLGALVTGPISKQIINEGLSAGAAKSGYDAEVFTGHTEYLCGLAGVDQVVMMLAIEQASAFDSPLRVALVTTHLPLAEVSAAITDEAVTRCVQVVNDDLTVRFGIDNPRILVCGLNPHAGEGGVLGSEEERVINPALSRLKEKGIDVSQAMPADTVFTRAHICQSDAIVAMYHDQGLAPLKSHGFGKAVNITLGLPVIRTSVDHGTAFDIAGSGRANEQSLLEALKVAAQLAGQDARSSSE